MMSTMRDASRQLDQFYTDRDLAKRLVALARPYLSISPPQFWLEPSAGDGAFLEAMPKGAHALDIDPRGPGIARGDFLSYSPPQPGPWVAVGNPPFGKNSSLALKFFNHAASFCQAIAFVVPRTFEKDSLQRRLDPHMHLVLEHPIDPNSFYRDGQPCAVPCVFQVWQRRPERREHPERITTHPDFAFVDKSAAPDFAFQRVGVRAGLVKSMDHHALSAPSHYFIRVADRAQVGRVRQRLEAVDWNKVKHRTSGNPSIGKHEMIEGYSAQP